MWLALRISRALLTEKIDEGYAFVPAVDRTCPFNGILWVNEDGKAIFDLLKTDIPYDALVKALAEQSGAPEEEVAAEVDAFLAKLDELKLLQ